MDRAACVRSESRCSANEAEVLHIEDLPRAQAFADRFCSLNWSTLLTRYARQVNPLMRSMLRGQDYYWVAAQSEYSTDVLFKSHSALKELYPRLPSVYELAVNS